MTKTTKTTAVAAIFLLFAGPVLANDGAIEHRKAIYQAIGGHMKGMVAVLKGQVPHKENLAPMPRQLPPFPRWLKTFFRPIPTSAKPERKWISGKTRRILKKRFQPFKKPPPTLPQPTPVT